MSERQIQECNCHDCTHARWKSSLAGQIRTAMHPEPEVPAYEELLSLYKKAIAGGTPNCVMVTEAASFDPPLKRDPGPEVPEEIEDLISRYDTDSSDKDALIRAMARVHNADVLEAFNRGKAAARTA